MGGLTIMQEGLVPIVKLTGAFVPLKEDSYVLMKIPGENEVFIPVFSSLERFRLVSDAYGMSGAKLAVIANPREFLDSLPVWYDGIRLKIAFDPYSVGIEMHFMEVDIRSN